MHIMPIIQVHNNKYKSNLNYSNYKLKNNNSNAVTFGMQNILRIQQTGNLNIHTLQHQAQEYNKLFVNALSKANTAMENILKENGYNLVDTFSRQTTYCPNQRTIELLIDPTIEKLPMHMGPYGPTDSAMKLLSNKFPDAQLTYYESRRSNHPTLRYADERLKIIGSNIHIELDSGKKLYLSTPIRIDGILASQSCYNTAWAIGKGEFSGNTDKLYYSIYDPENNVDFVFSFNKDGKNILEAIRNQSTGIIAERIGKTGWFGTKIESENSRFFYPQFVRYVDEKGSLALGLKTKRAEVV